MYVPPQQTGEGRRPGSGGLAHPRDGPSARTPSRRWESFSGGGGLGAGLAPRVVSYHHMIGGVAVAAAVGTGWRLPTMSSYHRLRTALPLAETVTPSPAAVLASSSRRIVRLAGETLTPLLSAGGRVGRSRKIRTAHNGSGRRLYLRPRHARKGVPSTRCSCNGIARIPPQTAPNAYSPHPDHLLPPPPRRLRPPLPPRPAPGGGAPRTATTGRG